MRITPPILMIVTDPGIQDLDARLDAVVSEGGVWVQYRDRNVTTEQRVDWLLAFRERHPRCPVLVNRDLVAAERSGADGVHLSSLSSHPGHVWAHTPQMARFVLGEEALIGRSAHPDNLVGPDAFASDLDYLVFGTVFPSESHPGGETTGIRGLKHACEQAEERGRGLPILAIGGITPENAGECIQAGASGVAVIRAVLLADDPVEAVRTLRAAMEAA